MLLLHVCIKRIPLSRSPLLKLALMNLTILLSCPLSSILHCTARHSSTATSPLLSPRLRVVRSLTGAVVCVSPSIPMLQEVSLHHQEANDTLQCPARVLSTMAPGHAATPLTSTGGVRRLETPVGPIVVYSRISRNLSTGMTPRATPLNMASQAPFTLPLAVETINYASP